MTTIATISAPSLPLPTPPPATQGAIAPAGPRPRGDTPAVINDVASQAASAARAVSDDDSLATLRGRVGRVLEDIGSSNGFIQASKLVDWKMAEARFGKARIDEIKETHARFNGYAAARIGNGVAELQREPGVRGLSATRQEDGSFKVSEFSFTDGGSTYTVKQGTDGRMFGLKDGLGWKAWQVEPPASSKPKPTDAETALATLTALAGGAAKGRTDLLV